MAKITNRQVIVNFHTTTGTTAPKTDVFEVGEIAVQNTDGALYVHSGASAVAKFENSEVVAGHISTAKSELIGTDSDTSASTTIKGAKKYTDEKVRELTGNALTGVTVNGTKVTNTNNVAEIGDVVKTFGGQNGVITLKAKDTTTNGAVNLEMNGKELQASIVGLKSAAYTETTAYDAAGAATTAMETATGYTDTKVAGLNASKEDTSNGVTVKVDELEGKITGVTVTAPDFASTYLKSVTAGNKGITVGTKTDGSQDIKLNVKSDDNVLSIDTDNGLKSTIGMYYDSTNAQIILSGIGGTAISTIDASAFIKDGMLWGQKIFKANATSEEVEITKDSVTQKHTFTDLTIGHTYLAMCFINSGHSTSYSWEKLDVTTLVDVYTAGDGLNLDASNKFSIKLDTAGETFLTVGADGLKLSGVQTSIDTAGTAASAYTDAKITELNATVSGESHDVKVEVVESNGKLTSVTVTAPDFANTYDAKGAAVTAETNAKTYSDEQTINGKSGHTVTLTSDDIKFSSTTSSITEVIISNEKVTASALASLDTNKVSKETGKDLIATSAITKLEGIAAGAQVNVLEGVQVNGSDLTIDANKKVNVTVAEGTTNGTVKVNGTDIAVHGLGSAAYSAGTAFDAAGAAAGVKSTIDAYTVNNKVISGSPVLNGGDIKLDGYSKATTSGAVATTDTVNDAIGKLEKNIESAVAGGLQAVLSGDGISVSEVSSNKQTISAKIKTDEKVLAAAADGLSTTLSIAYDGNSKKVQLKGINNAVVSEFDATAFIKDGMLYGQQVFKASETTQTITIKEQTHEFTNLTVGNAYLAMCFSNMEHTGSTPVVTYSWDKIDVSSLIDVYTAGDGLALSDGKFSVKVNASDNEFLEVTSDGIRVTGVSTAIATAINGLDATVSQTAGGDGLALQVVETDGKLTSVTGSIATNTYVKSITYNGTTLTKNDSGVSFDAIDGIVSGKEAGVTIDSHKLDFTKLRIDAGEY